MRVLVTGGSGVVGSGVVTELLGRGHDVVLVSRHATEESRQWAHGVEARDADVTNASSLAGTAAGCEVVVHMVGIVEEAPPEATFARVNVLGTRHMLAEAARAGSVRFVFVSSLNAELGASDYHRSKRIAEGVVREYQGDWTIVRPGNVYGPGDEQISVLLRFVRGVTSLVPLIGDGDQGFQPLWWRDAARAIANVVERSDLAGRALDIAGLEVTSQNDLINRFSAITGRKVHAVPIPASIATIGAKAVSLVGWKLSLSEDQVQMMREGNVIALGRVNALTAVLGVTPTPLDAGLRELADQQPEQLPDEGIGSFVHKRFWSDMDAGGRLPEALFAILRSHLAEVAPKTMGVGAEGDVPATIEKGNTLTLSLPMRGHVQVRVIELSARSMTFVTLSGHPLAGAVRFLFEARGTFVRFQVEVFERAANLIDLVGMRALGDQLQDHTWTHVIQTLAEVVGATSEGVEHEQSSLSDDEATRIMDWLGELVMERKRNENSAGVANQATAQR